MQNFLAPLKNLRAMVIPLATYSRCSPPPDLLSPPHLTVATSIRISARFLAPIRRVRGGVACRAELPQDAPYAAAIGACILSSLAFPLPTKVPTGNDDETNGMIDTRLGVMSIISILPFFNWLCWVFAWLDSYEWRYIVYAAVYLAPYVRTNFSLSSDESWLPVASIILCIIHVQLEISIRNGDIEGFSSSLLFKKEFTKAKHKVTTTHKKVIEKDPSVLPSAKDESREKLKDWEVPQKLKDWEVPQKPFDKQEQPNGGENADTSK